MNTFWMDLLDCLDLDVSNKRSRRVRSWYLYEQLKSLERNQLDAARKLKERSYQDKILRQELSERRVRRNLYDQFGLCQSESRFEHSVKREGADTAFSIRSDDFYESFYEQQDVRINNASDNISSCSVKKHYEEEFKSVDEDKDCTSHTESVKSSMDDKSEETVIEDIENEIEDVEHTVVDEINLYFDEVKDNLECIEKLTELTVDDKIVEYDTHSIEEYDAEVAIKDKNINTASDTSVFTMWSKLVSFAYQIIQLNQGNCYVDYGSQFLTAVLACDVLRRGINRMCHILQPYVSPIKFATDESDSSTDSNKSDKRKKYLRRHRSRCTCKQKINNINYAKHHVTRKYRSENWQHCSGYSETAGKREQKGRRASEPLRRSNPKLTVSNNASSPCKFSNSSIWPDFSNDDSTEYFLKECCMCRHLTLNPMLKLSKYFDSALKELDDSMFV